MDKQSYKLYKAADIISGFFYCILFFFLVRADYHWSSSLRRPLVPQTFMQPLS